MTASLIPSDSTSEEQSDELMLISFPIPGLETAVLFCTNFAASLLLFAVDDDTGCEYHLHH